MQANSNTFSERLRALISERRISAGALAKLTGVSRSYLSQVLNGHRPLSPKVAGKVAAALDVPAAFIYFGETSDRGIDAQRLTEPLAEYTTGGADLPSDSVALHYLLAILPTPKLKDLLASIMENAKDKPASATFDIARIIAKEIESRPTTKAPK